MLCLTGCSGCNKEKEQTENAEEITQAPGLGEGEGGGKGDGMLVVKEFSVIIDKREMIYNATSYSNAQSLIEQILSEVQEGEQPVVLLHIDNAITDTVENLKNTLDKNELEWKEK